MSRLLSLLAASALAACSATANVEAGASHALADETPILAEPAPAETAAADASCDIRAVRTANGLRLEPVVRAPGALDGEYDFVVSKDGPSGSSDITQGGEFSLDGGATSLGGAEFSLTRRDQYRARLVVRDSQGELCRSSRRS